MGQLPHRSLNLSNGLLLPLTPDSECHLMGSSLRLHQQLLFFPGLLVATEFKQTMSIWLMSRVENDEQ